MKVSVTVISIKNTTRQQKVLWRNKLAYIYEELQDEIAAEFDATSIDEEESEDAGSKDGSGSEDFDDD